MKKSIAALALAGTIALTGAVPAMAATLPGTGPPTPPFLTALLDPAKPSLSPARGFLRRRTTHHPRNAGARRRHQRRKHRRRQPHAFPQDQRLCCAAQDFTHDGDCRWRHSHSPLTISEPGVYTLTATGVTSGHKVHADRHRRRGSSWPAPARHPDSGLANTGGPAPAWPTPVLTPASSCGRWLVAAHWLPALLRW